jgi:hypothetical protein
MTNCLYGGINGLANQSRRPYKLDLENGAYTTPPKG